MCGEGFGEDFDCDVVVEWFDGCGEGVCDCV